MDLIATRRSHSTTMPPTIDPEVGCIVPSPGSWPIDPQEDQTILDDRLWIDGCFDFFHHGHAGVMLQSRRLGNELYVGLHSDEEIAANKGPTVMNLAEREAAVNACRFSTVCVPHAPYVTSIPWISHYGCRYVTHGDDITSDADGNDCYRFVKKAGRMKIVPRTPGISTTDLVGRMLLCTKDHFIRSLTESIVGEEGAGSQAEKTARGAEMMTRIREYAAAHDGKRPYVNVSSYRPGSEPSTSPPQHGHSPFQSMVSGHAPRPGQRVVYVDGGFDLFSSGHIAFLQTVTALGTTAGRSRGWYEPSAIQARIKDHGEDYPPAYVIAGIHDDEVINHHKGFNYPIMNIFERGLCVVQCRYIHAVVFSAPYVPDRTFLQSIENVTGGKKIDAVYHGPTSLSGDSGRQADPYADAKALGIYVETPEHEFHDVNAAQIVQRILDNRLQYEERQRKKGVKGVGEEAQRKREVMQREQDEKRLQA